MLKYREKKLKELWDRFNYNDISISFFYRLAKDCGYTDKEIEYIKNKYKKKSDLK